MNSMDTTNMEPDLRGLFDRYQETGDSEAALKLQKALRSSSEEAKRFLRDRYSGNDENHDKEILNNSEQMEKADVEQEMAEHVDMAEKKETPFIQMVLDYKKLCAKAKAVEEELEKAKSERRDYYSSESSLGKTTTSDHRREKSFIAQEIEAGDLLKKMIALRGQIVKDFESIQDQTERSMIYKRVHDEFKDDPDELGLSHEILNYQAREIFAKNQEKKATLTAWQKEAENPKSEPEQKTVPEAGKAEGNDLISGIEIGEGLKDAKEPAPEVVQTEVKEEPKEKTINPIENSPEAAQAVEPVAEAPAVPKRELVGMTAFGPDGNEIAIQTPAVEFKEDEIPTSGALKPNQEAEGHKSLEHIKIIQDRMGVAPQVPQKTPPIRGFEQVLDTPVDKSETESNSSPAPAAELQPPSENMPEPKIEAPVEPAAPAIQEQPKVEPAQDEAFVQPKPPVAQTQTPEMVPAALPVQENPAQVQAPIMAAEPLLPPEPVQRRGILGWLKGKKNNVEDSPTKPLGRIDHVNRITGTRGHELTAEHLSIEPEEPNATDQKLAA